MAEERVLSGRYVLREVVGMGGMSIVYRAKDLRSRREVAIKVLRSAYASDTEAVRRFTDEAHAVLQMHHPNIVDIYGLGQDGDVHYIVMEYVGGVTLKEFIRQRGPISPRRAVLMAIRILAAVDHAHKNHIVHRDIKPQNILVNADFHIKVTDFGIAVRAEKIPDAQTPDGVSPDAVNGILGSVHYFSPEQASGQIADEKSDLYSVGVVLYEMLTGKVPFDGSTSEEVALAHVREEPLPPSSRQIGISPALDEITLHALAKNPSERYQSAAEMAAHLKKALYRPEGGFFPNPPSQEGDTSLPHPRQMMTKRTFIRAAIALAAVILCVISVFFARGLHRTTHMEISAPNMLLWDIEDAVTHLEANELRYTIEESPEFDERVGVIIAQYPEPGTPMHRSDRLTLYVSTGDNATYVPPLTGMTLEEALQHLADCGLQQGEVHYQASEASSGQVFAQAPAAGTYALMGTPVDITVSGVSAHVPDCRGSLLEDALLLLELSGFTPGTVTEEVSDAPPNTVIHQSIQPQTEMLLGTEVDLTVALLESALSFRSSVEVVFTVEEPSTEVRMTLEDEDGLRTVYLAQLGTGEYTKSLTFLSRTVGKHRFCVYVSGACVIDTEIVFR